MLRAAEVFWRMFGEHKISEKLMHGRVVGIKHSGLSNVSVILG